MISDQETQKHFQERYLAGATPWDSGISPPELLEAVTGSTALAPGRMLDLGCGTGTNCLTLASLGWQTVGVDFAELAIERAQQKAAQVRDLASTGGSVLFFQADVTNLAPPAPAERFSLLLDIGCLNSIIPELRHNYARVAAQQALPGALFLLYARLPGPAGKHPIGCTPEEIDLLFASTFQSERRELGMAPQGGASQWNWLRRLP